MFVNLIKRSRYHLWIFAVLVFLLLMLVFYFGLIKPQWDAYETLKSKSNQLKQSFEQKHLHASALKFYENQLTQLQARFAQDHLSLMKKESLPAWIEDLRARAEALDIHLISLSPAKETIKEFYHELPVKMMLQGEYRSLALWVGILASEPILLDFDAFKMKSLSSEAQKSQDSALLSMELILKFYLGT